MKILLVGVVLLNSMSFASVNDIRGSRYEIKVSQKNERKSFMLCDKKIVPQQCKYLGKTEGYTSKELKEISKSELIEARIKTGAVATVGVAGAIVGFFSGVFVAASASGAVAASLSASDAILSIAVGSSVAGIGASPMLLDRLNPWHQYAQAEVLENLGLSNSEIVIQSDDEILEIADLMSEILDYN